MKWLRPADPVARVERAAWALLGAIAVVLLLLSIASSVNYTSIVVAQESVYVVPSFRVAFTGIDSNGSLGADGSVTVTADLDIVNPSDRKSTRLNSSHSQISYAVFCLKKKKTKRHTLQFNLNCISNP